jgi:protein-tyrosine-phosphatase
VKRVLFVCVRNSGRSQMAAAFAERLGRGKVEAESAGTMPSQDWGLEDPAGKAIEEVRRIRDEVEAKVRGLLARMETP